MTNSGHSALGESLPPAEARNSKLETRIENLEARLKALDSDTLKAIGSNSVVEALVKRAADDFLASSLFKNMRLALLIIAGVGLVVWAGGTVYGKYEINSLQSRTEKAELKIAAADKAVSAESQRFLGQAAEFQRTIDKRLDELAEMNKQRLEKASTAMDKEAEGAKQKIHAAISAVEGLAPPAKERVESAAKGVATYASTSSKGIDAALHDVNRASAAALEKLNIKSIGELGHIKSQILALKQEGGSLT